MIRTLAIAASFALIAQAQGASGIFGTAAVLDVDGTKTLYATTLLGDSRHTPTGVTTPTLELGGFPASLGSFDPGTDTLQLLGGEMLTFKNGSDNITGANIFYRVNGGSFSSLGLVFNEDNVSGNSGDQRWYAEGGSVDLLSGLSNGVHTLEVYYEAPFTFTGGSGTHIENNGTSNYSVSFTVVPEPSIALLGGLGLLGLLRRRR